MELGSQPHTLCCRNQKQCPYKQKHKKSHTQIHIRTLKFKNHPLPLCRDRKAQYEDAQAGGWNRSKHAGWPKCYDRRVTDTELRMASKVDDTVWLWTSMKVPSFLVERGERGDLFFFGKKLRLNCESRSVLFSTQATQIYLYLHIHNIHKYLRTQPKYVKIISTSM